MRWRRPISARRKRLRQTRNSRSARWRAFARIHLKAGETRLVTLHVAPRQLQYWSEDGWKTAPGPRTVAVGASSRDLRLSAALPPS